MKQFFALTGCFLVLFTSQSAADDRTLHLGAVLSLSGAASVQGRALQDGIEFAKKVLVEKGWRLEIQYEDDGSYLVLEKKSC